MGRPLSWHHVLNAVLPTSHALIAQPRLSVSPAAQMVFNGLKDHAQSAAAQPTIGEQRAKLLSKLYVVGPVSTPARLPSQVSLDCIARAHSSRLSNLGH